MPDAQTNTRRGRPAALDRRNVYARIADDVAGLLRDGELRPGDLMPTERELVERYGVGRSSAREALRVLESRGLITTDERGTAVMADPVTVLAGSIEMVLDLHHGTLRDLYEVRRMLEVENAALAARRRTDEQLDHLRQTLDDFRAAAERATAEDAAADADMVAADVEFHIGVAIASGNPLALTIMEGIRPLLNRAQTTVVDVRGLAHTALEQHQIIFDAIRVGSPGAARSAMQDHLEVVEHAATALLDAPAVYPDPEGPTS